MPEDYQFSVSIYYTPMSFPLTFTVHTWIEISDGHTTNRYDLWGYPGITSAHNHNGLVYHNIFPDHLGTTISPVAKVDSLQGRQPGRVFMTLTGGLHSTAHQACKQIQSMAFLYPYAHGPYNMVLGPNSNTYVQWLLNQLQDSKLRLPWNAWGKGYAVKE